MQSNVVIACFIDYFLCRLCSFTFFIYIHPHIKTILRPNQCFKYRRLHFSANEKAFSGGTYTVVPKKKQFGQT